MNTTTICLITGLALGFAAAFGGVGALIVVLVFGGLGLLVGRWLDGEVDLAALVRSAQNRSRR